MITATGFDHTIKVVLNMSPPVTVLIVLKPIIKMPRKLFPNAIVCLMANLAAKHNTVKESSNAVWLTGY